MSSSGLDNHLEELRILNSKITLSSAQERPSSVLTVIASLRFDCCSGEFFWSVLTQIRVKMIERLFVLVLAECLCVFYQGRWSISLSVCPVWQDWCGYIIGYYGLTTAGSSVSLLSTCDHLIDSQNCPLICLRQNCSNIGHRHSDIIELGQISSQQPWKALW